mmetsp:Transcript_134059/g.244550  ORF Transcript_134059/g.244550 Transcript_134059/m.244550 type:complete len:197 (-) Transcript_134059:404-994(-)
MISYTSVIDACAKSGEHIVAEKWLAKAVQVNLEPDIISFNVVINACAKAGEHAKAGMWLAKAVESGLEPDIISYNTLINACANAGDHTLAEKWLSKALQAGLRPNNITCCSMLKVYSRSKLSIPDRVERILILGQLMFSAGLQPDALFMRSLRRAVGTYNFQSTCNALGIAANDLESRTRQFSGRYAGSFAEERYF